MDDFIPKVTRADDDEVLYFWAFGDLHYRARIQWHAMHSQRMAIMFQDLRSLWLNEGSPAFCVAPGDIVDTGAPESYKLAKRDLAAKLGNIPFYPGIGNHEFHPESKEDSKHSAAEFSAIWDKPVRYSWTVGNVLCIMLDHPNPYEPDSPGENPQVVLSHETLAFLKSTLEEYPEHLTIIFAHCPLRETVLDRDPEQNLDEDSQDPFFYVENSHEVRSILARHDNAILYISGHTHSGWGSPNLVFTEKSGEHTVTHLNLMSPWYTGVHRGPRLSADRLSLEYYPDDPDVLATFAIRVYRNSVVIGARDHRTRQWLAKWRVPPG
jgi:hypothetical protein